MVPAAAEVAARVRPQRAAAQLAASALAAGGASSTFQLRFSPAASTPRQALAAALLSADKALQKRKRRIIRAHKNAAAAAVAALSGVPVLHGVEMLSGFSFSPREQEWCAAVGVAPRQDWFRVVWSDRSKPSWMHVDQLGGYSDHMVRQYMLSHKSAIAEQATTEPSKRGKRKQQEPEAAAAAAAAAAALSAEFAPASSADKPARPVSAEKLEPASTSSVEKPASPAGAEELEPILPASKRQRSGAASTVAAAAVSSSASLGSRSFSRQPTMVVQPEQVSSASVAPRVRSEFPFHISGGQHVAQAKACSAAAAM